MYDAIVIGAGPAGLQTALTLGRMHRSALILDSGEYRNGTVAHMHNVIANDGTSPAQFRATARSELATYPDIELRDVGAVEVAGSAESFTVTLTDGDSARARRVVVATGVADDLPDVPGVNELWGHSAFACPFCDGHEYSSKTIGILGAGARAEHLLMLLGRIAGSITVFPIGASATDEEQRMLAALGAVVHPLPVDAVAAHGDGVRVSTGDADVHVDGLFLASGSIRQRAPFADQLGLRLLDSGAIEIDEFGRTSVAGVSAAGDLAHRASLPGPMASVVMAAAAGQMAAVGIVQELSVG